MSNSSNRKFAVGLARAAAGAIIFSLPILMTMEMWSLGSSMNPWHQALLVAMCLPLLVGMSHVIGFEETFGWLDDTVDAFVALAVGFITSAFVLLLLGIIGDELRFAEVLQKVAIQAIPASIGALLSQSQFGGQAQDSKERSSSYGGEIFLMALGALFLSFSVAPTEEVILIAHRMNHWQSVILSIFSLGIMHAFVYAADFKGKEDIPENSNHLRIFVKFTITGYALVLFICLFVLWVFGRMDGLASAEIISVLSVLGFPAAVGAAAARLII
ncbi:MAG TPA: TIGR02587 family membrane protein [Oligoflexus sp.]|uniref:TIGR02587 family membrane protein n=1 Tax=Oligoflexus sp. TaxID=1971216 RepID=UPI002D7EB8D7|nr:TIGR02587 family membrane protein [Oligoflexus sp.]HET9241107.1 TIGR02587 family membrane protein [Oligoflexus sp.]